MNQPSFFETHNYEHGQSITLLDYQTLGAPHNGTPESIAAAKQVGPKQGGIKHGILVLLRLREEGLTQAEACMAMLKPRQSMTGAFNALEREGQIRKLDGVTRPSPDGGECAVYVLGGGMPDEDDPAIRLPAG
jgi:hypothetical protein